MFRRVASFGTVAAGGVVCSIGVAAGLNGFRVPARSASCDADAAPPASATAAAAAASAAAVQGQGSTYDVCIVGGGIVGLATAREILGRFPGKSVVVLEKEAEVSLHQSGHNSGVIHAGIYYAPGSTMARCCVKGAAMMYEYCDQYDLPAAKTGKLICAPTQADAHHITTLKKIGDTNGVQGLRVLNADEVTELEPNVRVHSALYSPNTGIADFGAVSRHFAKQVAETTGSEVKVQFEVTGMELVPATDTAPKQVRVMGVEPGQKGPVLAVTARNVITCAGFHSDTVSKLSGGDPNPKVVTFRGTYYQMKPEFTDICKMNIYPTPSGGGIPVGVHFTPTVNDRRGHQMIVGPGACVCFNTEAYAFSDVGVGHLWKLATHLGLWKFALSNWDLAITEMYRDLNRAAFMDQARKLIPSVTDDMVEESFAGVMSQILEEDGKPASDFIYERGLLDGTTLNLRNAPTPACTASMALAEEICDQAAADFGWDAGREKLSSTSPFWTTPVKSS